ncbi:MAG: ABC-type transport auxiliary lipoprotein family protein [candidate division KSB1 bacterium]|nr:ABC-type transport auxiliary lipoprotein family protein [candidate division KSB1 bacterium]
MQQRMSATIRLLRILILFVFLLAFISCGRPPRIHYYTIEFKSIDQNNGKREAALPYSIGVVKLDGGVLYTDDRIIYRETPFEVNFWNYRRWIAPPNVLVTEALRQVLKADGLFQDVLSYPSAVPPRMILTGKVTAFEEWDEQDRWLGKVAMHLTLTDLHKKTVVWEGGFEALEPAEQRNPVAVVKSINTALNRCLNEVVQSLRSTLLQN